MTGPGEPAPPPTISCCVFAWDEMATLRPVVEAQLAELERMGVPHELLIIDDGSTDGTGEEADRLARQHRAVRVTHHGENRGLGAVYRTGFAGARGEFVTFFPADGQFPASILPRFYPLVEGWDLVLGNLPGRTDTALGAVLGRVERALYRVLLGHVPRLEGVFMFRREILTRLPLKSTGRGWTVVWELIVRAHRAGFRMVACPITMLPRTHGVSKVNNVRNVAANLRQLLALRRLLDP
jgi:glycosyltransferase involved in cell wall biosynthesis